MRLSEIYMDNFQDSFLQKANIAVEKGQYLPLGMKLINNLQFIVDNIGRFDNYFRIYNLSFESINKMINNKRLKNIFYSFDNDFNLEIYSNTKKDLLEYFVKVTSRFNIDINYIDNKIVMISSSGDEYHKCPNCKYIINFKDFVEYIKPSDLTSAPYKNIIKIGTPLKNSELVRLYKKNDIIYITPNDREINIEAEELDYYNIFETDVILDKRLANKDLTARTSETEYTTHILDQRDLKFKYDNLCINILECPNCSNKLEQIKCTDLCNINETDSIFHIKFNLEEFMFNIIDKYTQNNKLVLPPLLSHYIGIVIPNKIEDFMLADNIYEFLSKERLTFLLDDRKIDVNKKLEQAEYIGCPIQLTVNDTCITLINRLNNESFQVDPTTLPSTVRQILN
jgi:hypothetical protein